MAATGWALTAMALSVLGGFGSVEAAGGADHDMSHDPAFFRIDVDLLRLRPDRTRSVAATLCGLKARRGDDSYANRRFVCDAGDR